MPASVFQLAEAAADNVVLTGVAAGSTIHVWAGGDAAGTASITCSDNVNGSYGAGLNSTVDSTFDDGVIQFRKMNVAAGTVTVTCAGAGAVCAIEIRGVTTSPAEGNAGQHQTTPGAGADAVSSGNITPGNQPALLVALSLNSAFGSAPTAGTGFTNEGAVWDFGGGDIGRVESKRLTSTSAVAGTFTRSAANPHITLAAIYRESAAGAYTLTCATGALTLAGQAVSLLRARRLVADPLALTLVGNDVSLRAAIRRPALRVLPQPRALGYPARVLNPGTFPQLGTGIQVPTRIVGAYTLACATGAMTLAGPAVGLRAARLLPATTAALTLAGPAVNLRAGRRIAADVGALTLAGPAVGLRWARRLDAAALAIVLAGPAVNLLAGRRLPAAVGALVLVGNDVTLTEGAAGSYTMPAGTGALVLAGQAVSLLVGRRLVASVGALTLAGLPVGLRASRRLDAATLALVLAGQAATFPRARRLTADTLALTLSGVAVALRRGVAMPAGTGSLSLAGLPVALRWGRRLSADALALTLTGNAVDLEYTPAGGYSMVAAGGALVLAGQAVQLRVARRLVAGTLALVLDGPPVLLRRGKFVTLDAGALSLAGNPLAFLRTYVLTAQAGALVLVGRDVNLDGNSYEALIELEDQRDLDVSLVDE